MPRLRPSLLLVIVTLVASTLLTPRATSAQPATAATENPRTDAANPGLDAAQLNSRLAALELELQSEQALQKSREKRFAREIDELREQRKAAAEKLLSSQLEYERNAIQLQKLKIEKGQLAAIAKELAEPAASIPPTIRGAAEQLRRHLQEVPGSEAAIARVQKVITELTNLRDDESPAKSQATLRDLFAVLEATHAQSSFVGVTTTELFTAPGDGERVKLLRLGHVRFAYQTIAGDRIGMALPGLQNSQGFRWTEDLDSPTQELVRQAIVACESGDGEWITLPLDVAGRPIQPTAEAPKVSHATRQGWFGHSGWAIASLIAASAVGAAVIWMGGKRRQYAFVVVVVASLFAHAAILLFCCRDDRPQTATSKALPSPRTVSLRANFNAFSKRGKKDAASGDSSDIAKPSTSEPSPASASPQAEIMTVDMRSLPQPALNVGGGGDWSLLTHLPSPDLNLNGLKMSAVAGGRGFSGKAGGTGAMFASGNGSGGAGIGGAGDGPDGSSGMYNADQVDQPPREPPGNTEPEFPDRERRQGLEGSVVMCLLINEQGRVDDVQFVSGSVPFRQAVLKVARSWRFEPARHQGRLVKVWGIKEVGFTIRKSSR